MECVNISSGKKMFALVAGAIVLAVTAGIVLFTRFV